MKTKKTFATVVIFSSIITAPAIASDWQGKTKDAWLDGKVETALMLNSELNNFAINTDVSQAKVILSGTVNSDLKKELAEQIAQNVDGVDSVDNQITVDERHVSKVEATGKKFSRTWYDLSTTAGINIEYAANDSIEATSIDVDTKNGTVVLTGSVNNDTAHDLAIEIAKGFDHVKEVKDNLIVAN
ncbi:Osmotically-inducible protein Y [Zhongshania aliphaticivorans]|uniref:Osmotically-inducible protein Y n=1 Tax=Zhongshania aliphaticivorans TaxID=1470434 RepID=A0A5S9Q9Z6_9GAMM|nr:BON domain-containing protein [Zhongshania aliphaticivorans]CAA0102578.1 Osmotically-inducible protein Y [Zhongshania aliphaticivorans]CAA0114097.1 Osmotically-inducible protein Y [Zhongshania aliphaticivorans]